MEKKNAEIITIGEEYISHRDVTVGADVIARFLNDTGIAQKSRYYVDSDEEEIFSAVVESMERYEMTFITGSFIGFMKIAARVVARSLGVSVVSSSELFSCFKSYAKKHDIELPPEAENYAVSPEGASPLICEDVPLSGYVCEKNGRTVVVVPGNPEFVSLICDQCLAERFRIYADDRTEEKRLNLIGCKYGDIMRETERIRRKYPSVRANVFQGTGEFSIALSVPGACHDRAEAVINDAFSDVMCGPLAEHIYGCDTDLPAEIVRRLAEDGDKLATAESCTGGLIAKLITDVPGASEVFPGGVVSYSNEIKKEFLGVDGEVLAEYGAVSHRVAIQMAEGVRHKMGADWGIGVTGIAGPGGGTPDKPVGLVYIAIASKVRSRVLKFNVDGDRENVRASVARYALRELLYRMMRREKRKEQE